MKTPTIHIYDSTLRDGAQAQGISYSVEDKIKIVERLDALGVSYIEAGNPGSNPKDLEFFRRVAELRLTHSKIIAFGATRKVGIRASVRPLPLTLYVRLRGDGKLTSFLGFYPTTAQPDMDNILDFFVNGNRGYIGDDPVIKDAMEKGAVEFDPKKRTAIYEKAIDHINQQNLIFPVADLPMQFVHTKEVTVKENRVSPIQTTVVDFYWAQ